MFPRFQPAVRPLLTSFSKILRSPRFHHGVRRIHRTVEDLRHGRDPSEPLRPGEATGEHHHGFLSRHLSLPANFWKENPNIQKRSFLSHFVEELRNQFRGTPTNPPPPSPPKK